MKIPLSSIHIKGESRIRERGNLPDVVTKRVASLLRFGQFQPIIVEPLSEPVDGKEWELIDGEVRTISMLALSFRHEQGEEKVIEAFKHTGLEAGMIEATTKENLDPIMRYMMEFHINEDADKFSWEEKGAYVRTIHDMLTKKHGRKEWTASKTAEYISQSEATVSHYLALTDPTDDATKSERVKTAKTKGAALKQLKIEKERQRKQKRAASAASPSSKPSASSRDHAKAAELTVFPGDCRDWIAKIPDGSLDWFHWDPPYGGAEGSGGAFTSHQGISTDHDYAMKLMLDMLPEIWRTLNDGSWLAIWYTPVHYSWLRYALQGHRFDSQSGDCLFCGKNIIRDHVWLSDNYSCRPSPYRFWTNPYPNYWLKEGRVADGHEIQRFLTKETEPFLLCGKQDKTTPILLRSDRGNVFRFPAFAQHSEDRRHVHHKPAPLLSEILSLISVPGALGGDAGAGSGSIIEAATESSRRIVTAELDDGYRADCVTLVTELYQEKNWGPDELVSWIPEKLG